MDATQYRLENFLALFNEFKAANPELPNRGMLKLFADRLELSDRYLSHVKCGRKQIGAQVARQIEAKCGKDHGWLDTPHNENEPHSLDERIMVEQILSLYRVSPVAVKRLVTDAIKTALADTKNESHSGKPKAVAGGGQRQHQGIRFASQRSGARSDAGARPSASAGRLTH